MTTIDETALSHVSGKFEGRLHSKPTYFVQFQTFSTQAPHPKLVHWKFRRPNKACKPSQNNQTNKILNPPKNEWPEGTKNLCFQYRKAQDKTNYWPLPLFVSKCAGQTLYPVCWTPAPAPARSAFDRHEPALQTCYSASKMMWGMRQTHNHYEDTMKSCIAQQSRRVDSSQLDSLLTDWLTVKVLRFQFVPCKSIVCFCNSFSTK